MNTSTPVESGGASSEEWDPHKALPLHFKTDRRNAQRSTTSVRRHSERLYGSCQAIVRGVDSRGETFTEATTLENVSAGGLYLKLPYKIESGAHLFVVFAFSTVALQDVQAPRVAVRGQVCRVEALGGESGVDISGIGLQFNKHRFM